MERTASPSSTQRGRVVRGRTGGPACTAPVRCTSPVLDRETEDDLRSSCLRNPRTAHLQERPSSLTHSGSNLIGNHRLELAEGFDPFDAFVHPFASTLARLRANESRAQLFARSSSSAPSEWVGLTRSKMHAIDDMPRKEKREPTLQTPNDCS
jgi:hypothetical protein